MQPSRRQSESGFALLIVFVMAAAIAVMLYQEMPRVGFEGQRAKEELLIDRGLQYKQAIKLFARTLGRYPATIEQLENTNNIRFLRHRFKDPMTGKDDWRIIHAGPGGMLIDSLTMKAPGLKDANGKDIGTTPGSPLRSSTTSVSMTFGSASEGPTDSDAASDEQTPALDLRARRWASDTGPHSSAPAPGSDLPTSAESAQGDRPPEPAANSDTAQPEQSGQKPGQQAENQDQPPLPGQPPNPDQAQAGQPAQPQPGQPAISGGMVTGQVGQQPIFSVQPGQPTNPGQNPAIAGIWRGLTGASPLPPTGGADASAGAGSGGLQQAGGLQALGGPMIPASGAAALGCRPIGTPGIAGVASRSKSGSIRSYNNHDKYREWEFVCPDEKDRALMNTPFSGAPMNLGNKTR